MTFKEAPPTIIQKVAGTPEKIPPSAAKKADKNKSTARFRQGTRGNPLP